ncbi:MAG: hypothetical protein ACTHXO_01610, partial [Actinomycetaceae bacterium]
MDALGADTAWLESSTFNRFDITSIGVSVSRGEEVDLDASTTWVLRYDGTTLTEHEMTASALAALPADQLADVVAVAVTFQATDPVTDGGTITAANELRLTFGTQLRPTLRLSGDEQTLEAGRTHTVVNRTFIQSVDPVLSDGTVTGDLDDTSVLLSGGEINVAPAKSVTP